MTLKFIKKQTKTKKGLLLMDITNIPLLTGKNISLSTVVSSK